MSLSKQILALLVVILLSQGCGGGGGGSPPVDPNNEDDIIDTNPNPTNAEPVVFYSNSDLNIVMADRDSPVDQTTLTTLRGLGVTYTAGDYDYTQQSYQNYRKEVFLYLDEGVGLFRVNYNGGVNQTAQRVSSYDGTRICNIFQGIDYIDTLDSSLFFTSAGGDGQCGTDDDSGYQMVKLNMGENEAPVAADTPVTTLYEDGAIVGYLAITANGTFTRYTKDFEVITPVINIGAGAAYKVLKTNPLTGHVVIEIFRSRIFSYSSLDRTISNNFFDTDMNEVKDSELSRDGNTVYLLLDNVVYQAPIDGSVTASELFADADGTIESLYGVSEDNHLIYGISNGDTKTLKSYDIENDVITTLYSVTFPDAMYFKLISGDRVYFTVNESSVKYAYQYLADGTDSSAITQADWIGMGFRQSGTFYQTNFDKVIAIQGLNSQTPTLDGAMMVSYDGPSAAQIAEMGAIPTGLSFIGGQVIDALGLSVPTPFWGNDFIVAGFYELLNADVLLGDISQADSLTNITNTPDDDERVYF